MTRWFRKAKSVAAIVPITRFVDARTFVTKRGGYGCAFRVAGVDAEGLDQEQLSRISNRISDALRSLPDGCGLLQYFIKRSEDDIPHRTYHNGAVQAHELDRLAHLREHAHFGKIELYWVIYAHRQGAGSKNDRAEQTAKLLKAVHRAAFLLESQLSGQVTIKALDEHETANLFSYLLTLDPERAATRLRSRQNIGHQIARVPIECHSDYFRIGNRYAKTFSLKEIYKGTRPNLLSALLSVDSDIALCSHWIPKTTKQTRSHAALMEGFLEAFKQGMLATWYDMANKEQPRRTAGTVAAEKATETLGGVLDEIDNQGRQYGHYSVFGMAHSRSSATVDAAMGQIYRAFNDPAQAVILEEGWGALCAYYNLFPGNDEFNVRRLWLNDRHHANVSFVYSPNLGHLTSETLEDEYLTVFESRDRTPFYFDPYVRGVRGLLGLGPTGSGKSIMGNHIVASDQKYGGYTYIFDIGRSYENTVLQYGGTITRVGANGPRVSLFALEPTDDNLLLLFHFVRLLLVRGGVNLTVEEELDLGQKVRMMYALPPAVRRLKSLANILPTHIGIGLTKWIEGGVYGKLFDNTEGELQLARLQCFDFQDVSEDHAEMLEPILFWLLRQIKTVVHDPANMMVPKHLLFDEIWKQLQNEQLLDMVLLSLKTGRKNAAGVTLLTHTAEDLGAHAHLIKNACPMTMYLGPATYKQQRELLGLNNRDLELIDSLRPREFLLKRQDEFSKVLKLTLDPKSLALTTTRPRDRARRQALIDQHGSEEGIKLFAATLGQ